MTQSQLDTTLSPTQVDAISAAFQTIRDNLPFLVALSAAEKRRLFKIGIKAQTFVEKALTVAETHPSLVPQSLEIEAARRHLTLFSTLMPILQELKALTELVECTQMVAGSEAYASARLTYQSIKTLGKGLGLGPIVDDLARQFRATRRRNATPTGEIVPQIPLLEGERG